MHVTAGVNLCVCQYTGPCVSCVIFSVGDNKLEYQQKPCHPCQTFSNFDDLLHNRHTKMLLILRYQGTTSLVHNIIKEKQNRCSMATHPAKETRQQKEQGADRGL